MTLKPEERCGLYVPESEKDSCGIGFVANLKNRKSHQVITMALDMLEHMEHRGGCGCDPKSGDGAGILMQLPHEFMVEEGLKLGIRIPDFGAYGVAVTLFPSDASQREEVREIMARNAKLVGLEILGYRVLPVDNSDLGRAPRDTEPQIEHAFIALADGKVDQALLERKLYIFRNYTNHLVRTTVSNIGDNYYITSCSSKTVIYKGQLTTAQVPMYFTDLRDERVVTALALVHSRFSTNTFPAWRLAQPFRYIAHNGEINTVRGNINWMKAREALLTCEYFTEAELAMLKPICDETASDSANFDMVLELLVLSGRSIAQALMMMIPEAWQENPNMDANRKAFYEYHAAIMEPWDGPASVCFTDGTVVGATLDRNGLRPSRYCVTSDDFVVMASESGATEIAPERVIKRGRLQPGRIFIADLEQGRIITDEELKNQIATAQPYGKWVSEFGLKLKDLPAATIVDRQPDAARLMAHQQAFGYTTEDIRMVLKPILETGKEALGSMGADWPLAVLSHQSQILPHYFKQLFAQVTNPPIDSINERVVMSTKTFVGRSQNLLVESGMHCHKLELESPILSNEEIERIRYIDHKGFQARTLETLFKADGSAGALKKALERLCQYAADAVTDGYSILILSDKGLDSAHAAIPPVLATAAVHHHLIRKGLRAQCDLIVETGEARETHHFAVLIGYGASAVNPYLAIETLVDMRDKGWANPDFSDEKVFYYFRKAMVDGLLKIFAKMGISTIQSYHGAQIFEILGLGDDVVGEFFTGTVSRIGGLNLDDIAKETLLRHQVAFPAEPVPNPRLDVGGVYQWKQRGENHMFSPMAIHYLQESSRNNNYDLFKKYCAEIDGQVEKSITLRSLLKFKKVRPSIAIEEVEPISEIVKRFATGAMSFGSISWEAHTTLAIAMNRLGGKSNSGEGGEDPIRFTKIDKPAKMSELFGDKIKVDYELQPGDSLSSAIKQVASGRFGVTSHYLANANELQIKMAQGAKPGEGGQLPGHKVDEWIGATRHSTPGVGLISPPPHHDIYSIEDLAQLIFDLKNSNRDARISVKLVSEAGVGTVATGVCKAKADHVLIAGYDGGTGASPLSSIRHAGLPWELGLAETHQTLVRNRLRSRIVVQTDGQLRTPRDLAIAAMLGAEEWGIATAGLVVAGCIMMRKCHLNTCPVGVATQDERLRERFTGKPEYVENFFRNLAQGLREVMAELGFRTVEEMVGQTESLEFRKDLKHWKYQNLRLDRLLYKQDDGAEDGLYCTIKQDHGIDTWLDWKLIEAAQPALTEAKAVTAEFRVCNTDRSTGTMLSNEVSKVYGGEGLPTDTINFKFRGTAGQSFGAFGAKGLRLELEGDANDYFGKGLSGAHLVIYHDRNSVPGYVAEDNQLIGNVSFFGATKGEAYIRGLAGERFCVRNSGAEVVVEGCGDHGCEYMTGGLAIVLGSIGRNFAAGMSGGLAYVLNEDGTFHSKYNPELVDLDPLSDADKTMLRAKIERHQTETGSAVAQRLLADWDNTLSKFIKVYPKDYKAVLAKRAAAKKEAVNG